jgi:hypothetical protein
VATSPVSCVLLIDILGDEKTKPEKNLRRESPSSWIDNSGGREKNEKKTSQLIPRALRIDNTSTIVSLCNKKKTRRRIWRLWSGRERLLASAGSPWAEARVGQPWLGLCRWVDVARRHRDGANHRSALLVAASGGTGAAQAIQPSSPAPASSRPAEPIANPLCKAQPELTRSRRPLAVRWMSHLGLERLRLLRASAAALRVQSRCGCVPAYTISRQLTAQPALSTVTPPRTAPPSLSCLACASPS